MAAGDPAPESRSKDLQLFQTRELIVRAQSGDAAAREQLYQRYYGRLTAWAHGRLPRGARSLYETQDLVQMALERSLTHLDTFESRFDGAFGAYLRQIVANLIRDELRRIERRPVTVDLVYDHADPAPSPLEDAIGADLLARYERALGTLTAKQSQAVALRVELHMTYQEIAGEMGLDSDRAAYMLVSRGVRRLAEEMGERRTTRG
jgi:RNA polymerase sigma-70 factor (ECF subfamily)